MSRGYVLAGVGFGYHRDTPVLTCDDLRIGPGLTLLLGPDSVIAERLQLEFFDRPTRALWLTAPLRAVRPIRSNRATWPPRWVRRRLLPTSHGESR